MVETREGAGFVSQGEELSAGFKSIVADLEQADKRIMELENNELVLEYARLLRSRTEDIEQIKKMSKTFVKRDVLLSGYLISYSEQERSSINRKKLADALSHEQIIDITDFKTVCVVKVQAVPM